MRSYACPHPTCHRREDAQVSTEAVAIDLGLVASTPPRWMSCWCMFEAPHENHLPSTWASSPPRAILDDRSCRHRLGPLRPFFPRPTPVQPARQGWMPGKARHAHPTRQGWMLGPTLPCPNQPICCTWSSRGGHATSKAPFRICHAAHQPQLCLSPRGRRWLRVA